MKITLKQKLMVVMVATLMAMPMMAQSPLAVHWEMGQNEAEPGYYSSRFVMKM